MSAEDVRADLDLDALNAEFEHRRALDIVDWAVSTFDGRIAVSSSFGADSAVMLHLCTRVRPDIPVITVDTGFLFPETVAFRDRLAEQLGLNLKIFRPRMDRAAFLAEHGKMWRVNPDACCAFNKREPFDRAKRELGLHAWFTGIRREQSRTRKNAPIIEKGFDGLIKVCPIATWTAKDVHYYLQENGLPYHPLRAQGFLSIGCQPEEDYCTKRVEPGQDPRAGRWAGFDKTECGLHTYGDGSGI
ncbi:MAG: phosphoadenylyl-sulfate reductase [Phycisphaerae bacterium]|nr:phosphoadenylyl-sulfate reductase [Phycisphaerae bacterium]